MAVKRKLGLNVNGEMHNVELEPHRTLLEVLREELHLVGTKEGCGKGDCGACTVLMDGEPVFACLTLAVEAQGKNIRTIEGLSEGEALDPLQQAFVDHWALQCGFCTPGMIMKTYVFLAETPGRRRLKSSLRWRTTCAAAVPM